MKKILKVLGIIAVPLLLIAAFYGYHAHRAISLDEDDSLADSLAFSKTALSIFTYSVEWDKAIQCKPMPRSLNSEPFGPSDYLQTGSVADVYYGTHDEFGKQDGYELGARYAKDSLKGEERSKWGAGTITAEYRKEDSCYYTSKLIEVDDVDSIIITKIANIPSNETRRYIGKRKNGMVTECINCRLNNGICDDTISVERIELNPATGKIAKMFSKTRETYFEGVDLWVQDEFIPETQLYDNLGRLVEASFDGKKFRYEHSTNDTANLDVKIYDESGTKLGFYKRNFEKDGSRKTVLYGNNFEETRVTSYYKDGKLVKEESSHIKFYDSKHSRTRLFNSAGDEVLDSSFYESSFLPGMRNDANSYVVRKSYDDNGKLTATEEYEEAYERLLPFIFFPLKSVARGKVRSYELEYDAGSISSITFQNDDVNFALRRGLPALSKRIVFSKGKLEDINECREPYDLKKILKPRSPQKNKSE